MTELQALYCSYESQRWITRDPDPQDSWDRGDYGGSYSVTGVYLSGGYRDEIQSSHVFSSGDQCWIVYASYTTGSTFGSEGGYGCIIAITPTSDLAIQVEKAATKLDVELWPEGILKPYWFNPSEYSFAKGKILAPWIGYFESLDAIRTENFIVHP